MHHFMHVSCFINMAIIILCNRLPSNFLLKNKEASTTKYQLCYYCCSYINWVHKGDWPYGGTTWMNFDNMDEIEYWKWNWPQGQQMDEIDGAIEPYDMTWIFLKMYIFHVIYHMDENNESHLKNSHIDEVANIDELPIYWYLEFGESLTKLWKSKIF